MPRALILLMLLACDGSPKDDSETGDPDPCPTDDQDCDGFIAGPDCDDNDAAVNPGAADDCGDDVDENCDGVVEAVCPCTDGDGDGYPGSGGEGCDQDCDDGDTGINPAATESCDGQDNDCDGEVDEVWAEATSADTGTMDTGSPDTSSPDTGGAGAGVPDPDLGYISWWIDADGDGYGDPDELLYACSDNPPVGYVTDGSDCDDLDAADHPGADEVCDDQDDDEDCDGLSDDDDASTTLTLGDKVYADRDGDGYGDPTVSSDACDSFVDETGLSWVRSSDDCDDGNDLINPGEAEACDDADTDEDCDGLADDADPSVSDATKAVWYMDDDGDTYTTAESTRACDDPDSPDEGYSPGTGDASDEDCDDADAAIHPDAIERCNGFDDDCDGDEDEDDSADAAAWYGDADEDGYGDPYVSIVACYGETGYVGNDTDCDDTDSAINPDAFEVCDGIDQDCDGTIDDDSIDASTWYADADVDGYGWAYTSIDACDCPVDYVADATDCDDRDRFHLGPRAYYRDGDGDGFGDPDVATEACDTPDGYATNSLDCDDSRTKINPGQDEICDGLDNDCDEFVDDDDPDVSRSAADTWYYDADDDGYGDLAISELACSAPSDSYASNALDCDDDEATIHPLAAERCNSLDDDCDGTTDEGVMERWYSDSDGDGYGDPTAYKEACSAPSYAFVADDQDCDDDASDVHPGADEGCDGLDQDCDGTPDSDETCEAYLADSRGLEASWFSTDNHAYLFFTSPQYWSQAHETCLSFGYHLVTIDDASEQAWVWAHAEDLASSGTAWYIGLHESSDRVWRWTSQEAMSDTPDCSAETSGLYDADGLLLYSDFLDTDAGQSCGLLLKRSGDVGWEDSECGTDDARVFICESCSGHFPSVVYGGAVLY